MPPPLNGSLGGLASHLEYFSPQGVLLPRVYGTIASPQWLELRGLSAQQATLPWTVYRLACQRLLPWLQVTFPMVVDAAWPRSNLWPWGTAPAAGPVGRLSWPSATSPWGVVCCYPSLGRPRCARVGGVDNRLALVLRCARPACACVRFLLPLGACLGCAPLVRSVCGVLGHLASVHRCARLVCCVACALFLSTWLLLTGFPAWCILHRVRCPWPPGP